MNRSFSNWFKQIPLLFLMCVVSTLSFADTVADADGWELKVSEDGIDVSTKNIAGQPLRAFKASTVLDAPLQSVWSIIEDVNYYPNWSHLCKSYEFVDKPDAAGHFVGYYTVEAPWPLKDRDVVIKSNITQDPNTLEITLESTSAAELVPLNDKFTRVPELYARWILKPVSPTKTYIEMVGHAHPGGVVPIWLANLVVTDVPQKTFQNLQSVIKESRFDLIQVQQRKSAFTSLKFPEVTTTASVDNH